MHTHAACTHAVSALTTDVGQGLGDRLRGMMMMLRLAAASKRVFIIDQQKVSRYWACTCSARFLSGAVSGPDSCLFLCSIVAVP